MMNEKGIIFSTPMVQAILEGYKTQTRRVLNPQPESIGDSKIRYAFRAHEHKQTYINLDRFNDVAKDYAPHKAGDTWYVRETWTYAPYTIESYYIYKADELIRNIVYDTKREKWRSPMYMPRSVARIFLRITDVRVERLQDISEEDAVAEGCSSLECPDCNGTGSDGFNGIGYGCTSCLGNGYVYPAVCDFKYLWNSINGKKKSSAWDDNPWVWVYTFERVNKGEVYD